MSTSRLYQENQYEIMNCAAVTAVRSEEGFDAIACSSSVFFPEGGGQPSDTGKVSFGNSVFNVLRAEDETLASDVWHITDAPAGTFAPGDEVTLSIDWDGRFRNMQRHLGEHMLSGTIDKLFGGVNRGFHMGADYITIDIDLAGRMLSEEELNTAERMVNDAIWADLPVTVSWFDDYASSLSMPVRKAVPHDGRVSVVTVGDPEDPYDCIACCGTHPARSSEVGLLAIFKCEPNKGMNRIYFDCGIAAWEKLTSDSRTLSAIAKKRSCSPADLESRLALEAEAVSELKASLASMTAYIKDAEAEKITKEITASGAAQYVCTSDLLSVDDLLKLGFSVIHQIPGLLLVMKHPASKTCLLLSSDGQTKCGDIVKQHAAAFGGRGGGRPDNARAVFQTKADMDAFVKEVCNGR